MSPTFFLSFPSPLRTPGECLNKLNLLKILQNPFKMGELLCSFSDTKKTLRSEWKLTLKFFLKLKIKILFICFQATIISLQEEEEQEK